MFKIDWIEEGKPHPVPGWLHSFVVVNGAVFAVAFDETGACRQIKAATIRTQLIEPWGHGKDVG